MAVRVKEEVTEIALQQVLLPDGSVFSVQWMVFPDSCADRITATLLLERYFKLIRDWTCSVIRPIALSEGVQFRLLDSKLALLSFEPPEQFLRQEAEEVQLRINGGFLVQAGECDRGMFSLSIRRSDEGVRVTVQLSDFCPLLLGSRTPSRLRRLLYRFTQAYIHKVVTVKYLSRLYRELTGVKIRARVKKVHIREGRRT